jgi:hypothetical protein
MDSASNSELFELLEVYKKEIFGRLEVFSLFPEFRVN